MNDNEPPLIVTDAPELLPADLPLRSAADYLAESVPSAAGRSVINLCQDWRYLSKGYYVSLVAEARGQMPTPTVHTLEGMADPRTRARLLQEAGVDVLDPEEIRERLQEGAKFQADIPPIRNGVGLRPPRPDEVTTLLLCMGRTPRDGFRQIGERVFRAWPAPLLRAGFVRENGHWLLYHLSAAALGELSAEERAYLAEQLRKPYRAVTAPLNTGPSLAILYDETDEDAPSDIPVLDKIARIARKKGLRVERLGINALDRLGEHDALFIRAHTRLDLPAYTFASRAAALGMPVIDHPRCIARCSNKVFLYELFARAGLGMPQTAVIDQNTEFEQLAEQLGLPIVLKQPDGSFSHAVFRVYNREQYEERMATLLPRSPLLLAQRFTPSTFDWRIGVLDGKVLYGCRYFMAPGHWQIRHIPDPKKKVDGRVETVPNKEIPRAVRKLARAAAELIGEGMYGVDIKEGPDGTPLLIEINDNPDIHLGEEDAAEGDALYERLVDWFVERINPRPKQEDPTTKRYRAYEVMGLELEYAVVDAHLRPAPLVESLLAKLHGRPTSDAEFGEAGFSSEMFDHVLEIKNNKPLEEPERLEAALVSGVQRAASILEERGARLLPGGMHPWLDPAQSRIWTRSNQRIYRTYARLFEVYTHGWANVQSAQINLPMGSPEEAVAMMNAAALLVPYLPALAASSPMFDGQLQPSADNRLQWILQNQARLPASIGELVPEYVRSLTEYKRKILGEMYQQLDRLPDSSAARSELLNVRGAVFRFSRQTLEIRALDLQECPRMDIAIACFVRRTLRWLAERVRAGQIALPPHEILVDDLQSVIGHGSLAEVQAPHLGGPGAARQALSWLLERAPFPPSERPYQDLVAGVLLQGSLSERIRAALERAPEGPARDEAAKRVWSELAECLTENRPWQGR